MTILLSFLFTAGAALWASMWLNPAEARGKEVGRLRLFLTEAGYYRLPTAVFLLVVFLVFCVAFLVVLMITLSPGIALCLGSMAAAAPFALVNQARVRRRRSLLAEWPDAVDHLRSSIRAGRSLPESLIDLAHRGPQSLREPLQDFEADHRAGASFDMALTRLKDRLSDPVGDRVVESLRIASEVGGSDLGRLLGTLSMFLRESARTRKELEARQSWTISAAKLAVAAPWIVLLLLSTRPEALQAYNTPAGTAVLIAGLIASVVCYRLMMRVGALPQEKRVLA